MGFRWVYGLTILCASTTIDNCSSKIEKIEKEEPQRLPGYFFTMCATEGLPGLQAHFRTMCATQGL